MKAILVRFKGCTERLPARYLVKIDGQSSVTVPCDTFRISDTGESVEIQCAKFALNCWGLSKLLQELDFCSGILPNGDHVVVMSNKKQKES